MKEVTLRGKKVERVDVEVAIPFHTLYEEVKNGFYQNIKFDIGCYLKEGKICLNTEYGGSHSYFEESLVKDDPTQKEKDIIAAFSLLDKYRHEVAK